MASIRGRQQASKEKQMIKATEAIKKDIASVRLAALNLSKQNLSKIDEKKIQSFINLAKDSENGKTSFSSKDIQNLGQIRELLDDAAQEMLELNKNFEHELTDIFDNYYAVMSDKSTNTRVKNQQLNDLKKIVKSSGGNIDHLQGAHQLADHSTYSETRAHLSGKKISGTKLSRIAPNAIHSDEVANDRKRGVVHKAGRRVASTALSGVAGAASFGSQAALGATFGAIGLGGIDSHFGLSTRLHAYGSEKVSGLFSRNKDPYEGLIYDEHNNDSRRKSFLHLNTAVNNKPSSTSAQGTTSTSPKSGTPRGTNSKVVAESLAQVVSSNKDINSTLSVTNSKLGELITVLTPGHHQNLHDFDRIIGKDEHKDVVQKESKEKEDSPGLSKLLGLIGDLGTKLAPIALVAAATFGLKKAVDTYVAPVVGEVVDAGAKAIGIKKHSKEELDALQRARDNTSVVNTLSFGLLDKEHGFDPTEARAIRQKELAAEKNPPNSKSPFGTLGPNPFKTEEPTPTTQPPIQSTNVPVIVPNISSNANPKKDLDPYNNMQFRSPGEIPVSDNSNTRTPPPIKATNVPNVPGLNSVTTVIKHLDDTMQELIQALRSGTGGFSSGSGGSGGYNGGGGISTSGGGSSGTSSGGGLSPNMGPMTVTQTPKGSGGTSSGSGGSGGGSSNSNPTVKSSGSTSTPSSGPGVATKGNGTRSWRNNNPGNIEYGKYTKSMGAVGSDGRFAVFPTYEAGRKAQQHLLFQSGTYKNLTLGQAINKWAPGSENNVPAYIKAMGADPNTKMSDFTPEQQNKLLDAMQSHEGYKAGAQKAQGTTDGPSPGTGPSNAGMIGKGGDSGGAGATGSSKSGDTSGIVETQGKVAATRKLPIQDTLKQQLAFAAERSGVKAEIFSGGQASEGGPRTGSHRHDNGGAADLKLYRTDEKGNKQYLDMRNPEDAKVMKNFTADAIRAGATGVGAATDYMGPNSIHIGGGSAAVWGKNGTTAEKGGDPDKFVTDAFKEGMADQKSGEGEKLFQKWKDGQKSITPSGINPQTDSVIAIDPKSKQASIFNPNNTPTSIRPGMGLGAMVKAMQDNADTSAPVKPTTTQLSSQQPVITPELISFGTPTSNVSTDRGSHGPIGQASNATASISGDFRPSHGPIGQSSGQMDNSFKAQYFAKETSLRSQDDDNLSRNIVTHDMYTRNVMANDRSENATIAQAMTRNKDDRYLSDSRTKDDINSRPYEAGAMNADNIVSNGLMAQRRAQDAAMGIKNDNTIGYYRKQDGSNRFVGVTSSLDDAGHEGKGMTKSIVASAMPIKSSTPSANMYKAYDAAPIKDKAPSAPKDVPIPPTKPTEVMEAGSPGSGTQSTTPTSGGKHEKRKKPDKHINDVLLHAANQHIFHHHTS